MNWKNIFKPIIVIRFLLNFLRRRKRKLKRTLDAKTEATNKWFHKTLVNRGYHSKPDFIIIGVQKAGTSALFNILNQHSLIIGSATKEIHYFDKDSWYNTAKLSEYHAFWPLPFKIPERAKLFEATPIYIYHPHVAQRLFEYNPNLRLILILRNPSERALSAWTMYNFQFSKGKRIDLHDSRTFRQAVIQDIRNIKTDNYYCNGRGYVKRGLYLHQIKNYLKYFNKDQLLILESQEIRNEFDLTLQRIYEFLGIPPEKLELKQINARRLNNHNLYQEEIQLLNEFYYSYNEDLFNFLGYRYNWNDWKSKN
jgi:phage anti-repressor protein